MSFLYISLVATRSQSDKIAINYRTALIVTRAKKKKTSAIIDVYLVVPLPPYSLSFCPGCWRAEIQHGVISYARGLRLVRVIAQ